MGKYLFVANYTLSGTKGLIEEGGSGRRAAIEKMISGAGGKLESFYFGFGHDDAYVIADLPDNETAAAVSLTVAAAGAATATTIVLLTPEQVDNAAKKHVSYRKPGA